MLLVGFSTSLFAATIVFKSGRTIEGEIIERTDESIKVDVYGIPIKYFLDEIVSIKDKDTPLPDKQPENKEIDINSDMDKDFVKELLEIYDKKNEAQKNGDLEEVVKYVSRERGKEMNDKLAVASAEEKEMMLGLLKAMVPLSYEFVRIEEGLNKDEINVYFKGTIKGLFFGGQEEAANGKVTFLKEEGAWRISVEDWQTQDAQRKIPAVQSKFQEKKGSSSISGTVKLPSTDKQGDLYINFKPAGQIISTPESERYFTVIKKGDIRSDTVTYKIENVPEGKYFGYAVWDIAEPFWEPSWGQGNCPGYAGDYTGGTGKEIIVSQNQSIEGVDFKCANYLKPIVKSDYGSEYKILDLKYEKDPLSNKPKLLMTLKNTDSKPLQEINIKANINGKDSGNFFVSGFGSLLDPGEEETYDIECYDTYIFFNESLWKDENLPLYELDIILSSEDNNEVFKKHISITDLKVKVVKKEETDEEGNVYSDYDIIYE